MAIFSTIGSSALWPLWAMVGHGGPWWAMVGKDLLLGSPSQRLSSSTHGNWQKTTHEPIGMDIHINETCLKTVKSAKNMGHFYRIYATGEQGVI